MIDPGMLEAMKAVKKKTRRKTFPLRDQGKQSRKRRLFHLSPEAPLKQPNLCVPTGKLG